MKLKIDSKEETQNNSKKCTFLKYNWKSIIILGAFLLILGFIIFSDITVNFSSNGNTLDIINLLISSEVTIIAIVITLSLVAVQLAASSYSSRVIDIFKESNSFRAIVILYISSMILGVLTLILANNSIIIVKLFLIDYYLGITAYIALIPFIWITFDLLRPSTIISKLARRLNKYNILRCLNKEEGNKDPFQPLMDIIQSSIIKYDIKTVKDGLKEIENNIQILFIKNITTNEKNEILKFILLHFNRICNLAISKRDEETLINIINVFLRIGVSSSKWEYNEEILNLTTGFIKNIGNSTAEERMKYITETVMMSLEEISKIAAENNNSFIVNEVIFSIQNIINISLDTDMEGLVEKGINYLVKLENTIIKHPLDDVHLFSLLVIISIVIDKSMEKENDNLTPSLLKEFIEGIEIIIKNKLEESKLTIDLMVNIRGNAIEKKLELTSGFASIYLGEIFRFCLIYDNKEVDYIKNIIVNMGKNAIKENFIAKKSIIISLNSVLKILKIFVEKDDSIPGLLDSIEEITEIIKTLDEEV